MRSGRRGRWGWHQLENGKLLSQAEDSGFQVMVTGDKNLSYQQNLRGRKLALIVLPTIDWNVLKLNPAAVAAAIDRATPGSFERLEGEPGPVSKRALRQGPDAD